jgi:pimeloyl-ACP methyl ester carboxylesterase
MTARVVLVHGAWHGAWCWERVVAGLAAADIASHAVDLPGHGADPRPMTDLHGDAAMLRRTLDEQSADGSDLVLVGHSYGGAVITEAGDHPAVRHLVYLCALALSEEETCTTVVVPEAAAASVAPEGGPDLVEAIVLRGEDVLAVEPSLAAACLYNECDAETAAWAVGRLGDQPLLTMQQTPAAVAWRAKPSTYVVCDNDRAVPPGLQRVMATRCTSSVEWASDHSPFLSHPERVVRLLTELAGQHGTEPR